MVEKVAFDPKLNFVIDGVALGRTIYAVPIDYQIRDDDLTWCLLYIPYSDCYVEMALAETAFDKESTWHLIQKQFSTVLLATELSARRGRFVKGLDVKYKGLGTIQVRIPDYREVAKEFQACKSQLS